MLLWGGGTLERKHMVMHVTERKDMLLKRELQQSQSLAVTQKNKSAKGTTLAVKLQFSLFRFTPIRKDEV